MVTAESYRHAVEADIPLLARHHRLMFEEMRMVEERKTLPTRCCSRTLSDVTSTKPPVDFEALERAQMAKLEQQFADGSCVAWIAEQQEEMVASGGISIIKTVAIPEDRNFEVAFLHSMYTIQAMRGRGIASTIIDRLLDHCRQQGLRRILLNASEAGRDIYRKKGFKSLEQAMILWL